MVDVRVGCSGPSGFDSVVPAVGLVQVGQRPAVAVVHTLGRVGGERDALPEQRFLAYSDPQDPTPDGGGSFKSRLVEIRTVAGPANFAQWVLSGGPYTVSSQARHVQVVWPPPCPRHTW